MLIRNDHRLVQAANTLVRDHFAVQAGESVLLTVDPGTDTALVDAVFAAVAQAGGRPLVGMIPQLPFQGALADAYVPDALVAAAAATDVWLDFCFPYMAGSRMHDGAMKAGRARYALLATAGADSLARLYGGVDFAALMDFQVAVAEYVDSQAGKEARFTCPLGTDVTFTLDKVKLKRQRVATSPGMHTAPGAQSLYPVMDSVRGRIVLQALFDEIYRPLRRPITIEVDGRIQGFSGAGAEDQPRFERALRRASNGVYGYFIHFTLGFHPATRMTGRHFIEDIRVPGTNAIGMGLPWWEAGGGENHPDGVVFDQSLWIDGELIVDQGRLVGPTELLGLYETLTPRFY
ncbi:hypothetical protein [Azospirillum rugosum]|uniref:Leucyl aminopeptidase (Aminopeptidase T) n=1 Tax=Azospirillum rugosum TaxID=416170 RepID=A0ABS4ST69_9PROT|nr:hypothetical protein [Azospirillum rugosum]MBP2295753.1 leucyl aminopeptidase (aminopeptidase T) [Azospirillum rugosum]MDQ0529136.1 leucyl aminopeptidase (aminopeptidase T) [Azospirillum rugosum]